MDNKLKTLTLKAHAKLNLLLNIKGKQDDGYHELELINTELELHDVIELEELEPIGMENIVIECDSSRININISEDESNLCHKAAKILIDSAREKKGIIIDKGIKIKITKNIPVGGLGGGSADCAAVLKGLNKLWDLKFLAEELVSIASTISSDACYSIVGGTCLIRGKGENIEKLPMSSELNKVLSKMRILLVNPDVDLPENKTALLYSKIDLSVPDFNKRTGIYFESMQKAFLEKDLKSIIASCSNVFEAFKFEEYEKVYRLIDNLKKWGCDNSILAGSGPTVVGLMDGEKKLKNLLVILASNFLDFQLTKIKGTAVVKRKLNITLANEAGFCFGVERAINIAKENRGDSTILGQLIHNKQVIEWINSKGLTIVDNPDELEKVKTNNVIITAHGVADSVKQNATREGYNVIDATCPLVTKVHNHVKDLESKGYKVVVIGQPKHTEVIGITKDLKDCVIVRDLDDVERLKDILKDQKLGIVVQTTQEVTKVNGVVETLKTLGSDVIYYDTICAATKDRQTESKKLAKESDLMIVVGGLNSSNTKRLHDVCSKYVESYHIETAGDLKKEWFNERFNVGITAGASTPFWVIDSVVDTIKEFGKE